MFVVFDTHNNYREIANFSSLNEGNHFEKLEFLGFLLLHFANFSRLNKGNHLEKFVQCP